MHMLFILILNAFSLHNFPPLSLSLPLTRLRQHNGISRIVICTVSQQLRSRFLAHCPGRGVRIWCETGLRIRSRHFTTPRSRVP